MAQRDQILSRILHLGGNQWYNAFWTLSMAFWDLLGSQKGFICSYIGLLEAPRRAPKVLKWVSDVYPVNIGQLNHYVVFGTKYSALQDFQRGKTCPIGVKQTPLDPPKPPQTAQKLPQTPLNPFSEPSHNQFNPSSYHISH